MNVVKDISATITIVDHHRIYADATAYALSALEPDWTIQVFQSGTEYLAQTTFDRNEIILAEIGMKDMSGLDFVKKIKRKKGRLIVLSHLAEVTTIKAALQNGANGFLAKDITPQELIQAIGIIQDGGCYIAESLRTKLIGSPDEQADYHLSPREKQVLQLICSGKTILEAAAIMNLGKNTIQAYYRTILKKLRVNRASDLIVLALQTGLYVPH